jgi:hypothetical protein
MNEEITEEEWVEYFKEILEGEAITEPRHIMNDNERRGEGEKGLEESDIVAQIGKLKKKKAAGEDNIKNEAIIYCEGRVREHLVKKLMEIWAGSGYPDRWRKGVIAPIFKKGDDSLVTNYRGVTLLNTQYKLYAMVLGERLREEAELILPDSQAGFRKGRSGMENVFVLNYLVGREINNRSGRIVAFFVDFKAAFDFLV